MNTPAQVTKEHCALWNKLYNLAFNECFGGDSSDAQATQLIADSEAKATAQLRAEVERFSAHGLLDCHTICDQRDAAIARADRAEAELAVERARLDYIDSLSPGDAWIVCPTGAFANAQFRAGDARTLRALPGIRAAIDAAMKEGAK